MDFQQIINQFLKTFAKYPFDIFASGLSIAVFVSYIVNKKSIDRVSLSIGFYAVSMLIFEAWNTSLAMMKTNNFHTYSIFFVIEGILLIRFYRDYFLQNSTKKSIVLIDITLLFFIIFGIIDSLFIQKDTINSYVAMASGFILTFLAISYLLNLFDKMSELNLLKSPQFIINTGILLYFSGTFIAFTFMTYFLFGVDKAFFDPWHIITALLIIFRLTLCWGIWVSRTYDH